MGGYIQQQLLLGTGRTRHELVQSTDCLLRQLTLRAEHASTQSSQVEGRIHRELLQMAGNTHFQLLMASSPPALQPRELMYEKEALEKSVTKTKEKVAASTMAPVAKDTRTKCTTYTRVNNIPNPTPEVVEKILRATTAIDAEAIAQTDIPGPEEERERTSGLNVGME